MDKYEDSISTLEEVEKKLSVTRELKFGELQKEIDNTVTIADYEEMAEMEEPPKKRKKKVADTSEVKIKEVKEEPKKEEVKEEVKVEEEPKKEEPKKVAKKMKVSK